MKNYVIKLAIGILFLQFNLAYAQQDSSETATSINQKIAELKAIRDEGLISGAEYKKKNKELQIRLKKLLQTNSVKNNNNNAVIKAVEPIIQHQQPQPIENIVTPKSNELSIKQVEVIKPLKEEVAPPSNPIVQPKEVKSAAPPIAPPPNPKAIEWNEKSFASANSGAWAEAIRTASVAISLDQNYVSAYINRCRAYLGHGDIDEATQDCDTALKLDPLSMLAINNRGAIMSQQGKQDAALAEYEKACFGGLEIGCDNYRKIRGYSPKDTAAIAKIKLNEAQTKFSEKNWDGAITSATEAINMIPNNVSAYVTRSGAYANAGKLPESLADSETVIRLNPDEGMGYNNRGYVYEVMKKLRQAALDYEIACGLKVELGCINLKKIKQLPKEDNSN